MDNVDEAAEEIKKRRKKRTIKVAITEGLMVLAVFLMVTATTLIAIGYNVNPRNDWSVERTGLVQIQSFPTGATVNLDGENLFAWTNMSRSMTEGEHQITISKDGYDSWTKKISVTAGLYYRLAYPRLFLKERKTEEVTDFSKIRTISFAKDGKQLLAIPEEGAVWRIWKINEDAPSATEVDLSGLLPKEAEIRVIGWSGNSERVLVRAGQKWVLIDVKRPKESVDLSEKFGMEFSDVKIANDAASELFVLEGGNLRKIDIDTGEISGALIGGVESFSNLKSDVVYVAKANEKGEFFTGIYRKGEEGGTAIGEYRKIEGVENQTLVGIGEYFGEYYVVETSNSQIGIYKGAKLPSFGGDVEMNAVKVEEIGFVPEKIEVVGGGGLFVMSGEGQKAVFDVETGNVVKITTFAGAKWLDEFMLYQIEDGKLEVMDFDGGNKREIVENVAQKTEAKISKNGKWMYYLSNENKLMRTKIFE